MVFISDLFLVSGYIDYLDGTQGNSGHSVNGKYSFLRLVPNSFKCPHGRGSEP